MEQHPAGMGLDMIGKKRETKRKRQARQDAQSEGSGFYKMMGVKADDIEKQRAFARQRILARECKGCIGVSSVALRCYRSLKETVGVTY